MRPSPSPEDSSDPTTADLPTTDPLDLPEPPSLMFQQPSSPPDLSSTLPSSSESPDTSPPSDPADDSASPPRLTGRAKRAELRAMTRAAVKTAGGLAHQLLTVEGSIERETGLFLPDAEDVHAISDPLAGLASRRMPEGAENPDVADLVRLVLGLLGYGVKQHAKRAHLATMAPYVPEQLDGEDVPAA